MRTTKELFDLAKKHSFIELCALVSREELIQVVNTGYYDANHAQKAICIDGETFTVDEGIHALILKLWQNDIRTKFSCQGDFNSQAYITFDNLTSLTRFHHLCPEEIMSKISIYLIYGGNMINSVKIEELNGYKFRSSDLISISFDRSLIDDLVKSIY